MKKHLRCAGYVLAGIGVVLGFFVAALLCVAALIWASLFTASLFDLPDWAVIPISLAYLAIIAGAIVGVAMCREYA